MKFKNRLKFDHLFRLTDSTGIFQHASFSLPDFSKGYTTDDNARALIIALKLYELTSNPKFLDLAETYLAFLRYAQREDGLWHNYIGYNREYLDDKGSEDAFGRAFMCICFASSHAEKRKLNMSAKELLYRAYNNIFNLRSPRALAFTIIGTKYLYNSSNVEFFPNISAIAELINEMANKLCNYYYDTKKDNWFWFEEIITYSNGILPASLFEAYSVTGNEKYLKVGLESLNFLSDNLFNRGYLKIVGNKGWWKYGEKKAEFDEQPIDAISMMIAYATAKKITKNKQFNRFLRLPWEWFFGKNSIGVSLYDEETGGCFDGITEKGINQNEGAESLISLLGSYIITHEI